MSTIVYTRTKHQPEVLYLPLEHGGFIMLQEGSHQYPEHAGYGLKNSSNPVVQQYIRTGQVTVQIDTSDNINMFLDTSNQTQFAPFNSADNFGIGNRKISYSNDNENSNLETIIDLNNSIENNKRTRSKS